MPRIRQLSILSWNASFVNLQVECRIRGLLMQHQLIGRRTKRKRPVNTGTKKTANLKQIDENCFSTKLGTTERAKEYSKLPSKSDFWKKAILTESDVISITTGIKSVESIYGIFKRPSHLF